MNDETAGSGDIQQYQTEQGGQCLDVENFLTGSCRTVQTSEQNASEKKHLHIMSGAAEAESPNKPAARNPLYKP
jgi:hypothetical protein